VRKYLWLPLAVFAMLVGGACGNGDSGLEGGATTTTQATNTITGSFTLLGQEDDPFSDVDGVYLADGSGGCSGSGGYEDIGPGLQARVSNESGTVIGTGNLGPGEVIEDGCRFYFSISDVPVAKFYRVEVGGRGEISYSYEQMKAAVWNVSLSLG
jgi:hypothetical protein